MTDPLAGTDAAARLDKWAVDAKAKAERYQAMSSAAHQVAVRETSPDGLVTVTIDSAGNVTDLKLTDRVQQLTGAQVAAAVLTTMRRAQAKLADRLGEVMAATIGDDRRTTEAVLGSYRAKFPEPPPYEPPGAAAEMRIGAPDEPADGPPPQPRPRHAPARPRRPADDEDVSFDDDTFLRGD
ncbi:MAG TPA: YbaB/EbfC family nucleoid-associated protein [Pseudonocardiaceae bacterium]|jgi:DNA-binding protein YbaB|nr:YbaB/EbfC family nucleoid-associated protein [Pseudonocardiaceae bacterium]